MYKINLLSLTLKILEKLFKLHENKNDPQTEIFARLIIFVTMTYTIFVNFTIIHHMDGLEL
jgi:xanthine/uracil/vitamin C permease (AzgA family)